MILNKKSKALTKIEEKISQIEKGSLRHSILVCAKNFKSSWIELGQYLLTVYQDKEYKRWGYLSFEVYCSKEIGIRKQTALKLLRSYRFLETEEPEYLSREYRDSAETQKVPSYEAVNTLRQVKTNKDLGIADYERIKRHVFEEGKANKEVKDVYRAMVKATREEEPEQARRIRRLNYIRRMVGTLSSIKKENEVNKFLPHKIINDLEKIIKKIEQEIV